MNLVYLLLPLLFLISCSSKPIEPIVTEVPVKKVDPDILVQETFNKYCDDNQAKRNISDKITVTIYGPVAGISLDKAQDDIKDYREKSKLFATEIYALEAELDVYKLDRYGRQLSQVRENELISKELAKMKYGYGLNSYKSNDIELKFETTDLESLQDLHLLRHYYTFNFSKEFQQKYFKTHESTLFKKSVECNNGYTRNDDVFVHDYGFLSLNSKCEFNTTAAIGDRQRLWRNFALFFTTVKESIDPNNNIKYEVSLNMDLFCKHSVLIKDLKTN